MPLVTWPRGQTHTHAYIRTEVISINQAHIHPAHTWFKKLEGWIAWFGESSISQTKNCPIFT